MTTNPVCVVRTTTNQQDVVQYKSVYTFCPGCELAHPFQVELGPDASLRGDGSPQPIWNWDGNLETPTFNPSMLCYSTVHICKDDHSPVVCDDPDNCGTHGHLIMNDDWRETGVRVLGHNTPHTLEVPFGNCHSFLHNGVWQFLNDSAHKMAGQSTPMVPLPDWLV